MELERLARAKRVQLLREMTKLSRRKFAKETGISHSTMQHWEDGKERALPEKSVMRLLKALVNLGIHCSYDWLMQGTGLPPQYIDKLAALATTPSKAIKPSLHEETQAKHIQEELALFLKHNRDAVELILTDDAMEPKFVSGEVVAGIRYYGKDIEQLVGLDCIVLIQGGDMCLRTLLKGSIEGCYHLAHSNIRTTARKPFFYDVELVSAAPVIWTRRKLPIV